MVRRRYADQAKKSKHFENHRAVGPTVGSSVHTFERAMSSSLSSSMYDRGNTAYQFRKKWIYISQIKVNYMERYLMNSKNIFKTLIFNEF